MKLTDWKATPAGGAITIKGLNEVGRLVNITGFKEIYTRQFMEMQVRWWRGPKMVPGALRHFAVHPKIGIIELA